MKALGLEGSEVVVDLGAGPGYFTFRLAQALPNGRVIAIDSQPEMARHIHRKVLNESIHNIQAQVAKSGSEVHDDLRSLQPKSLHHLIGFLPLPSICSFKELDVLFHLLERLELRRIDAGFSQRAFDGRQCLFGSTVGFVGDCLSRGRPGPIHVTPNATIIHARSSLPMITPFL